MMNMRCRHGFGQIEIVVSTVIVGVLMVSSFSTIAASRRSQILESNKVRGLAIAEALMNEIAQLPTREPTCDCGFGPETGETTTSRINFDDVDDYNTLLDSPPRSKNGTTLAGYSDLRRRVIVDRVSANDWNVASATYVGIYRVTVIVQRGTSEVCRVVGYRTSGSPGSASVMSSHGIN